ncbi:hypothetical protein JCM8547_006183 [Rhodosporidiobolus lusitaniae]
MSLKQELQIWADALKAFDKQDFDLALSLFEQIADTSRVFFNIGLIHATLGGHEQAVAYFSQATVLDPFLAVAFFQSGVSQFLLGRFAEARSEFDEALLYLRDNIQIDYDQLGLRFKLYSCEVLFNRGLSSIYQGRFDEGMQDLFRAQREKQADEHGVIDEAVADRGQGYTVFSVPVGVLFRPSDTKLKNLETKDYLGRAKVVAASDANDLFIGFSGTRKLAASAGTSRSGSGKSSMTGTSGLERSKTSAARLESSGDGVAMPLRARPTLAGTGASLRRSQTEGAVPSSSGPTLPAPPRTFTASPQPVPPRLQLPTPPSSDDQPAPDPGRAVGLPGPPQLNRAPSSVRKTYGAASSRDIIDDYYGNPSSQDDQVFPPVPPLIRPSGLTQPTPPGPPPVSRSYTDSSELDRVATWAQQNALPSNPRNGGGSTGSPFLTRDNSAASSLSSMGQGPFPLSVPGGADYLAAPGSVGGSGGGGLVRGPQRKSSLRAAQGRPSPGLDAVGGRESALEGVGVGMLNLDLGEYEPLPAGAGGFGAAGRAGAMGTVVLGRSQSQASFSPSLRSTREEMVKVRLKLRYKGDVRGMSIAADLDLPTFGERVRIKFDSKSKLPMKYKDSEGALISILDADDWESAMDQAREAAAGRPEGKLEIILGEA